MWRVRIISNVAGSVVGGFFITDRRYVAREIHARHNISAHYCALVRTSVH